MTKYSRKPLIIEAEQLTWTNWSRVCDLVKVFGFRGVYLDAEGKVTENSTDRIGAIIPAGRDTLLACHHDYIIKTPLGTYEVMKESVFKATFEMVAEDAEEIAESA